MPNFQSLAFKSITLQRDELSTAANFIAELSKTTAGRSEYKLTLKLWLFMRQINPNPVPLTVDSDGRPFFIKPWSQSEWQAFLNGAQQQANLWNGRFWLKPPDNVKDYDFVDFTGHHLRPFIRCELETMFVYDPSMAHAVISVANLDTNKYLNPGSFRSASLMWCSQDNTPSVNNSQGPGSTWNTFSQPVLAHEIGHRLGLHHIGKVLKTPLCQMAQSLEQAGYDKVDWRTEGGRNSNYCYGWGQAASVGQNIMGMGATFTAENALPWLWAIRLVRNTLIDGPWQVLTSFPGYYF